MTLLQSRLGDDEARQKEHDNHTNLAEHIRHGVLRIYEIKAAMYILYCSVETDVQQVAFAIILAQPVRYV